MLKGLLLLLAILALAMTASAEQPAQTPASLLQPPPQASAVDIPDGQIDKAVAELDGLAKDLLASTGIPGLAIAVVRDGRKVYGKGFGVRKAGAHDLVDADTVFQLASLSKSIGATVVAREVGAAVIDWTTPVVKYLPWFALSDPWVSQDVTIGDLYAHRSGLPDHAGDDLEDLGFGRAAILRKLSLLPLQPFRAHYDYTNFGLVAAAEAVAAAAGTDWADLSETVLYKPLGMTATSSRFADFAARPNRAFGHVLIEGRYEPKYQRQPDAQSAAGGVSSSVNDMAKWLALILANGSYEGRQLVAADALLPALSPEVVSSPPRSSDARAGFYGYGFGVGTLPSGRVLLSHSGAFSLGAATNYLMIPSANVGIVILSNAAPIGAVEALGMEFADLVQFGFITRDWRSAYAALMAPLSKPEGELVGRAPPEHPAPAADASGYTGVFTNPYFGDVTVAEEGGALGLTIGPGRLRLELAHWDGDEFAAPLQGENFAAGSITEVTFNKPGNSAAGLTIEVLNQHGLGSFVRRQ